MLKKRVLILVVVACLAALVTAVTYIRFQDRNQAGANAPQGTEDQETDPDPSPVIDPAAADNLTVYYFDVGQGDCALLDYGQYECLIDAGDGHVDMANLIAPYVDGDLDCVVATHQHADHIGGMSTVFERYNVVDLWYNGETADTQAYTTFIEAADAEPALSRHTETGMIYDGALDLRCVKAAIGDTPNNDSMVVKAAFKGKTFLFMGDCETKAEAYLLSTGAMLGVDVLKVGHHGSCTASSGTFLGIIHPSVAIYSAGEGNSYGHPCREALERLLAAGARVWGTDRNGTVTVFTDGTELSVSSRGDAYAGL